MDTPYNDYIVFLKHYRDELSVYLDNEREKRRSLLDNNLERLETMLRIQQAKTMKFRVLESKRAAHQSKLNLPDVKAKDLLTAIDDMDARQCIKALFTEISNIANDIREQNRQSLELAKINQRLRDVISQGGDEEIQKFYGPDSGCRKAGSAGDVFKETI